MLRILGIVFVAFLAVAVFFDVEKNLSDAPDQGIANVGEFVGACQSIRAQCLKLVDDAMRAERKDRRIDRACLDRRPKLRGLMQGVIIWLNAHPELHPLPAEDGILRAADAIWPCRR